MNGHRNLPPAIGGLVAIALCASVVAGCGGSTAVAAAPTQAAATTPPEDRVPNGESTGGGVCALVDPSEAREALGGAAVDGGTAKHGTVFKGDGCVYRARDSKDWVSVWVYQDVTRADWDATARKTGVAKGDAVADLGEAAWLYVARTTGLRLDAFDRGTSVSISVNHAGIGTGDAAVPTRIVRSVLERLD